jgi:hypothetical protein
MSVMFEILEGLERKKDESAGGFTAKAWMQEVPAAEPGCDTSSQNGRASVSSVLNKLSKAMMKKKPDRGLLDMRFGGETQVTAAIRSARRACDSASRWASARLCAPRHRA